MSDYASRRIVMVDTQVRPSDVTKFPIIEAMLAVPREVYVPIARREAAYVGQNVDIGAGRVVLEARTFAKLLDAMDIVPTDRVLDVGCALGYSTAVLARLAASVVAVEEIAEWAAAAQANFADQGVVTTVVQAALRSGAAAQGPYDAITVQGGVEAIPDALLDQLKDGGRIGAVFMEGALGIARIGHKSGGRISWRFAFNATAPVLRGFAAARAFAL